MLDVLVVRVDKVSGLEWSDMSCRGSLDGRLALRRDDGLDGIIFLRTNGCFLTLTPGLGGAGGTEAVLVCLGAGGN